MDTLEFLLLIFCCASAFVFAMIFVIYGCVKLRRRCLRKSSKDQCLVEIKTPRTVLLTVPTQMDTGKKNESGTGTVTDYPPLTLVGPGQQNIPGYASDQRFNNIEIRVDPPSSPSQSNSDGSSETAENMSDTLSDVSVKSSSSVHRKKGEKLLMVHSYSTTNIASVKTHSSEMTMSLSLLHNSEEERLFVTLHSVYGLPFNAHETDVFAGIFLFPGKVDGQTSKPIFCTTEYIRFNEVFKFEGVTSRLLEKCFLRVTLFSRNIKKRDRGKVNRIGELSILCSDLDLLSLIPVKLEMAADRKRIKKHCTSDKLLERHLGELFLDLQFHPDASRLKVFIRRAEHLPVSEGIQFVKPVHYLSIRLMKNKNIVECHQSQARSGRKPVWNQAFLFDMKCEDTDSHYLEILLFSKGKLHSKDTVIGHVLIGGNCGSKSGREQWQNMQRPRPDVAKWHNILPVFKYT